MFTENLFKICFKTYKCYDNSWEYYTCRWTPCSSIDSILGKYVSSQYLTSTVAILASIEQVNTPQYWLKGRNVQVVSVSCLSISWSWLLSIEFFMAGKLNYLGWWLLAEAGGIEELRRIPWCCSNIFFSKIRFSRSIFSWASLSTAVGRLLLLGDLDLGFRSDIWATTTKDLPKSVKSK